jgi:hypothetical protein
VKKPPSKADIRAHLAREMERFEQKGGTVTKVPRGISGRDALEAGSQHTGRLFLEPSTKRTHVPEVIAAIEARRKARLKHKPTPKPRLPPKRRKKTIYDDFGEPLRTVWVED